ncbi:sigma-70 family RNA polymerase sigma factor [Streptomyces showdoensis]|uniref:RNA polymerase sigma factor n=1 Tax=Streptomyces showdoensis TaxID=68268 RepID=A0A2P2GH99_STREW|nr:sigma-70 family RNA polymerase sigma factor [Streptomyces showdoensis]KKZ70878.1 RNA polymerase subunit sigma [Streptomyces showdoensis]
MNSVEHRTAELVEAARAGDARAGDDLVRAYLPLVYNIVGRALDGHADVDDLVQDTMIRALDGLPALRDPARFRSWIVAIAMNRIRRRWRERQQAPQPGLDGAAALADPAGDFTELAILRLGLTGQRREVAEATRWLDEEDRELLSLWWLEAAGELSRAELAAALDLPPRHAAVRVQRMKARLETGRTVVRALAAAPPCPTLAETTAGWDGHPSPLWRKRLARHLDTCPHCAPTRTGLAPAEGLLVGFGLVPPLLVWAGRGGTGAMETAGWAAGEGPEAGSAVQDPGVGSAAGDGGSPVQDPGTTPQDGTGSAVPDGASTLPPRPLWPAATAALAVLGAVLLLVPGAPGPRAELRTLAPPPPVQAPPTVTPTTTPPPTPRPTPSPSRTRKPRPSVEERVNALVNAHRAEAGCGPLRADPKLSAAARAYGRDMVDRGYYGHTTPEGTDAGNRFETVGYSWSAWAENLARGQRDPAAVVADWMADPPHRSNLLDCRYRDTGVAAVSGPDGTIWVQELATPLG